MTTFWAFVSAWATSAARLLRGSAAVDLPSGKTVDTPFPLEFFVQGTPKSHQGAHGTMPKWKAKVHDAGLLRRQQTYELGYLDDRPLAIRIYYFPAAPMVGDVDNIVKPILDALKGVAYLDDAVLERVLVQKFEPNVSWAFAALTEQLAATLDQSRPVTYIRIDDDLSWRNLR